MTTGYEGLAEAPSPDDLKRLGELARQMWEAEQEVEKAETALKKKREELAVIQERTIPELMTKCGVKDFTTTTGLKLQVNDLVRASISEANLEPAVRWLDENGHGGLVKRSIIVEFPREKEKAAKALAEKLRPKFPDLKEKYSVHPQTLQSFIRGELAEGHEVPMTLFGATQFQRAVVKPTKDHASKNPLAAG